MAHFKKNFRQNSNVMLMKSCHSMKYFLQETPSGIHQSSNTIIRTVREKLDLNISQQNISNVYLLTSFNRTWPGPEDTRNVLTKQAGKKKNKNILLTNVEIKILKVIKFVKHLKCSNSINSGMGDENDHMYHCYNDGFTGATRRNLITNTEQILYNNLFLKILQKATNVHNLIILR